MIHLLIVDDESTTRNGLLHHIDWKALGVGMIQTADSGPSALEICKSFRPDLILSDIRMRGMDGVETCRHLRGTYPDAEIIFISGYSDKEYLKAAIELGAVNYIDKPVELDKLAEAAKKALLEIRKKQEFSQDSSSVYRNAVYEKRDAFFSLLERSPEDGEEAGRAYFRIFDTEWPFFRVFTVRTSSPVTNSGPFTAALEERTASVYPAFSALHLHREFLDSRRLVFLLGGAENEFQDGSPLLHALEAVAKEKILDTELFFAFGSTVNCKEEIHASYEYARRVEKTIFTLGYGTAAYRKNDGADVGVDRRIFEKFAISLSSGAFREAGVLVEQVRNSLREQNAVFDGTVKNIYFRFALHILDEYKKLFPEDKDTWEAKRDGLLQRIDSADTLEETDRLLRQQLQEYAGVSSKETANNSTVLSVKRYISENFGDRSLSVKNLADMVYLTPTYLSGLYKRKTGETIGEYITEVRISNAKALLRNKSLKLYHISEMVGYDDSGYFAKLFKKRVGITPSEYRERSM